MMNKRWATISELKQIFPKDYKRYTHPQGFNGVIPRLARQGRVERRLSERKIPCFGNRFAKSTVWEYYVPQVRNYFNNTVGVQGVYASTSRKPKLANHSRATARIN